MKLVRTILQIKLKKIGCKHCIITFTSVLASNYVLCVWFYIICSMVIHPTLRNKEPMNYIFWSKVFVKISFRMWKKLTQPLPLKNDWFGLALQGKIWTSKKSVLRARARLINIRRRLECLTLQWWINLVGINPIKQKNCIN